MKKKISMVAVLCCLQILLYVGAVNIGSTAEQRGEVIANEQGQTTINEQEKSIAICESSDTEPQGTAIDICETSDTEPKENPLDQEEEEESEYANFAIADVSDYVNVRKEPTTDSEIVGKIYDGAVAQILSTAGPSDDWFQITSGSVEGYIKSEFFIYGEDAVSVIDDYVTRYVEVHADRLNVRKAQSTDAERIGYAGNGEKMQLLEDCGEWMHVQYTPAIDGYVAAQYVTVAEEFAYAKTLEEEQAQRDALLAMEQRQGETEAAAPEMLKEIVFPNTTYTSNAELRQAIINYAMQFVGNRYVHGGQSLVSGTDCSGFTCYVLKDFGYSISRTPGGQLASAGRSIDYSQIQPGDIICYSSNGGKSCTHVALYIGDGQIVHAANSRKGVITSAADYEPIIGIRNVID